MGVAARAVVRSTSLATPAASTASRGFTTAGEVVTAGDAAKLSGYSAIEFRIQEDKMVIDAVQQFAGHNIGCLVTVNEAGELTGIISERHYISKIALLGRTSKETKIKEIATQSSKLVTAGSEESVQSCMEKMLASDIRHLPLVDDGKLTGMLSIKDLVKTVVH